MGGSSLAVRTRVASDLVPTLQSSTGVRPGQQYSVRTSNVIPEISCLDKSLAGGLTPFTSVGGLYRGHLTVPLDIRLQ